MESEAGLTQATDHLIGLSADNAERVLSIARILFCGFVVFRFSQVTVLERERAFLTVLPIAGCVLFSVWVLSRRRQPASQRLLCVSVAFDAVVCFSVLLHNAVWPSGAWLGVASIPDTSTLLIMIMAAGLRLSPAAAVLGSMLNGAAFFALIGLDRHPPEQSFANGVHGVTMYSILLLTAATVSVLVATRTRRLVERAAWNAAWAQRAQQGLSSLLAEHHQLRTLLASATLNSDLLLKGLEEREPLHRARELHGDLEQVNALVGTITEQALVEHMNQAGPAPADVATTLREVTRALRSAYGGVEIQLQLPAEPAVVDVVGGRRGLSRMLWNLIANACQGDGTRAATRVRVNVARQDGKIRIDVDDNGPGFSDHALKEPLGSRHSEKPHGTGMGLMLTERLVKLSDGNFSIGTHDAGGARVCVELPSARKAPRPEAVEAEPTRAAAEV